MRKLASVQQISNLTPIEGKDRIEMGSILGWTVIVQKNIYTNGDKVVFCEVDAKFPEDPFWSDLTRTNYVVKAYKCKTPTGKLYGQGYCFPISVFYDYLQEKNKLNGFNHESFLVGDDVSNLLGVTKHETVAQPSKHTGFPVADFPSHFIPITEEERIQSNMELLDKLKGKPYAIRLKVDGTSWTSCIFESEQIVCTHKNILGDPLIYNYPSRYWDLFYKYPGISVLNKLGFAVQAEMYGVGIQSNKLGIDDVRLYVFSIIDTSSRLYVSDDALEFLCREYSVPICPLIEKGDNFNYNLSDLYNIADNLKYQPSGKNAEGMVVRSAHRTVHEYDDNRISFKVLSREY